MTGREEPPLSLFNYAQDTLDPSKDGGIPIDNRVIVIGYCIHPVNGLTIPTKSFLNLSCDAVRH
jgi:hypothetical protein